MTMTANYILPFLKEYILECTYRTDYPEGIFYKSLTLAKDIGHFKKGEKVRNFFVNFETQTITVDNFYTDDDGVSWEEDYLDLRRLFNSPLNEIPEKISDYLDRKYTDTLSGAKSGDYMPNGTDLINNYHDLHTRRKETLRFNITISS